MRRLAFLVAAVTCLSSAVCQGGFLSEFSGHTVFGFDDARADGAVSFSVYETEDMDWTDDFGTGAGSFDDAVTDQSGLGTDVNTKLVLFYQVVNNDPAGGLEDALESFQILFDTGVALSSWGYVDGFVFTDAEGSVGATAGNHELGTDTGSTGDTVGDMTPTQSGSAPTGFASAAAAIDPSSSEMVAGVLQWNFGEDTAPSITSTTTATAGSYSSLLFATLDFGSVTFNDAVLTDFGSTDGDVVVPTPVPATGLLFLIGAPAIGVVLRRKSALAA